MGAAYGTAVVMAGVLAVASMGVMRHELVMKSIVPVVMAGVLGIYGLIIAVINQYRACATLSFSPEQDRPVAVITKLRLHPTNAARVQLPDGSDVVDNWINL